MISSTLPEAVSSSREGIT